MQVPFIGFRKIVPAEWIDINGHMNATHYGLAVYDAHVKFTTEIGLGNAYVNSTGYGKAALESHMIYEQEVSKGDELEIRSWLLAVDSKRLHFFHEVYNLTRGNRSAASEQVDIHIDLTARKSAALPHDLYSQLQQRVEANLKFPRPAKVGSNIRPPKNVWLERDA
ncbi:MAG: thioesterase family protein [Nitrosomonadaceae bacterium]